MRPSSLLTAIFALLFSFVLLPGCKKENSDTTILGLYTNNPTDGEIILAPFDDGDHSSGALMTLDKNGNVLKKISIGPEILNFTKWNYEGKTRYSYNQYIYKNGTLQVIYSQAVVLDENFNEVRRFNLLPFNGRTSADPNGLDSHDFILLSDDHYIALGAIEQQVNNIPAGLNPVTGAKVVGTVIQEVNNGQVLWEWNSTEHPEFYANSVEGNSYGQSSQPNDYMHCNSMYLDSADGNLVCSFRNQNQVVKIKRNTGEVMWKLGGKNSDFPITSAQQFLRQHDASVIQEEGHTTIMLVDNGLRGTRESSRILEIELNEGTKTIAGYKEFAVPNVFIEYMGSVQKRGDTYFIGGGSSETVLEYNYLTGERLFEMDLSHYSYRAFKY